MSNRRSFYTSFLKAACVSAILTVAVIFLLSALGGYWQLASPEPGQNPKRLLMELGHARAPKPNQLTVTQARYGAGDAFIDVTDLLKGQIKDNTLFVYATNDLAGDPVSGTIKTLDVECIIDGQEKSISLKEGGCLEIPELAPIDNSSDLLAFAQACPFEVGFFAMDFRTGKTLEYRPDQPACMASIVKLFTLLEIMKQAEAGTLSLDETINVSGKDMTIDHALDLMIGLSDNVATGVLTTRVGYDNVNKLPGQLGMEGLSEQILPKPGILDGVLNERVTGPRSLPPGSLLPQHATARGMVKYFELLDKGELISPTISTNVLNILDRNPNAYVTNVSPDIKVVGKGGSLRWNSFYQYNMGGWNAYLHGENISLALCVWCEWFPQNMSDDMQGKWCTEISNGIVNVLLNEEADKEPETVK